MLTFAAIITLALATISDASAIERWPGRGKMVIDPNDKNALVAAGNGIARTLMSRYPNDPPGRFENTHGSTTVNWWQTAIAWIGMINHYATTNDYYQYDRVIDSITLNQGEHFDYEPSWAGIQNGEGNDDEAWFVVMSLAGYDTFGANASGIDWLGNAQKAHYMMSRYWANSTSETDCLCGGGLRWQQDPGDPGWSYLNSITNGQYFLVSALLYERTNDTSYFEWAKDTYSWLKATGNLTQDYQVYDGITAPQCTQGENGSRRFSYLPAALIGGTATMYKVTGDSYWKDENAQFIQGVKDYYTQNDTSVLIEPSCTFSSNCSATNRIGLDRTVFKGILARELARSYTILPNPTSKEMIQESLVGMVKNCDYDWQCGYFWEGVDGKLLTIVALDDYDHRAKKTDFRNTTMQFQSLELVNAALTVQ